MEYLCWRRKNFPVSSDLKPPLGTIPILRQHIFGTHHPPYVSKNSTEIQQKLAFFWPHPLSSLADVSRNIGIIPKQIHLRICMEYSNDFWCRWLVSHFSRFIVLALDWILWKNFDMKCKNYILFAHQIQQPILNPQIQFFDLLGLVLHVLIGYNIHEKIQD